MITSIRTIVLSGSGYWARIRQYCECSMMSMSYKELEYARPNAWYGSQFTIVVFVRSLRRVANFTILMGSYVEQVFVANCWVFRAFERGSRINGTPTQCVRCKYLPKLSSHRWPHATVCRHATCWVSASNITAQSIRMTSMRAADDD